MQSWFVAKVAAPPTGTKVEEKRLMPRSVLVAYILATLGVMSPGTSYATCGEECDAKYSSDIDDCRSQFGEDPADADDLLACIQEAREDYRNCLDDCANAAISHPRRRRFAGSALAVLTGSLCRGRAQIGPAALGLRRGSWPGCP